MVPPLKRTMLSNKDLSEQPPSTYILAIGGGEKRAYMAVDYYQVADGFIEFFRESGEVVYACKTDGSWNILRRDVLEFEDEETHYRRLGVEQEAAEKLSRELNPDAHAAMDKMVERAKREHGISVPDAAVDRPVPTGQYL